MKKFKLLQKRLSLKHSSSWHPNSLFWAGCLKGQLFSHIMLQMHAKWFMLITEKAQIETPNSPGILAWRQKHKSWIDLKAKISGYHHNWKRRGWCAEEVPSYIISYKKMKSHMHSLLVVLLHCRNVLKTKNCCMEFCLMSCRNWTRWI